MHQDQRIGLALGVLLLGAAGAFFFRNDVRTPREAPRLRTAKKLDARIAEKTVSPYLPATEEPDHSERTATTTVSDLQGPSFGSDPFATGTSRTTKSPGNALRESFGMTDDVEEVDPIQIPVMRETDPPTTPKGRPSGDTSPSATGTKIHVVQRGETLSSIAAKELGSVNRYTQLFEANRDQLKHPNDVRVGMKLRIPVKVEPRIQTAPTHGAARSKSPLVPIPVEDPPPLLQSDTNNPIVIDNKSFSSSLQTDEKPKGDSRLDTTKPDAPTKWDTPTTLPSGQTKSASPTTPTKKFVPAKRAPAGAAPMMRPPIATDPQDPTRRKLTQLPPEDSGGKIAR